MGAKRQYQAGALHRDLVRQKGLALLDKPGTPRPWETPRHLGMTSAQAHIQIGKETGLGRYANLVEKPEQIAPGGAFEVFALGKPGFMKPRFGVKVMAENHDLSNGHRRQRLVCPGAPEP
jgi:hypothetical protein